ncbi:LD-carboxypeptidase [Undibacterium sp. LX40W]|uniref:LD-carboxypeptidase n=1 Tax=Undibacterium nitidum TaxID=2762298 RepID=A0A923KMV3_9BURK|nr:MULTISPECIES: LD-carboxypeptidase [Undibacterium]MBC3879933.1 LD-carboxypeptidase [Undibacterium nitidum]MBC3891331.1 LD-carboxypeptidase [Undibacterium sp. LX40W]
MKIQFPELPSQIGIAVVPLSGAAIEGTDLALGLRQLQESGFEVFNYYDHAQRYQRFGASDEQRIGLFYEALENPAVHVIMSLRGSYGISRLLPLLDFGKIAASGKLIVGYSDINALQLALLSKVSVGSLCGPMFCSDFAIPDLRAFTQQHFQLAMGEQRSDVDFVSDIPQEFSVKGTLWGGNLAMITHLVGTEFLPEIESGILFVEDIAEHPYRVERMMLQLHMAGILQKQEAILFGDFSGYKLAPHDNGYDFSAMIAYLRKTISVPIITGLPFGHCEDKVSLFQGASTEITHMGTQVSLRSNIHQNK